jgi:hypothetical protein
MDEPVVIRNMEEFGRRFGVLDPLDVLAYCDELEAEQNRRFGGPLKGLSAPSSSDRDELRKSGIKVDEEDRR